MASATPFRIAFFSARAYDQESFQVALDTELFAGKFDCTFYDVALDLKTAPLAVEADAICIFVNDTCNAETLKWLHRYSKVKMILLRCAGFNNVDLAVAASCKMSIARVPAYSPYSVAEHAIALTMALNRKIHKAYLRNREGNYSLQGLVGFDMHGRTVGIVGTGNIGIIAAKIFLGFGCKVLAQSRSQVKELVDLGVEYVGIDELCARCDIISLHAPLLPATQYIINGERIALMKKGVLIINTSRGGLLDTAAAVEGLKSGQVGGMGLDVYEREAGMFFSDHTGEVLKDDLFHQLVNYPNVIVTGHQAFLTVDALANIAETALSNAAEFIEGVPLSNEIKADEDACAKAVRVKAAGQWKMMVSATTLARTHTGPSTYFDVDPEEQ